MVTDLVDAVLQPIRGIQ